MIKDLPVFSLRVLLIFIDLLGQTNEQCLSITANSISNAKTASFIYFMNSTSSHWNSRIISKIIEWGHSFSQVVSAVEADVVLQNLNETPNILVADAQDFRQINMSSVFRGMPVNSMNWQWLIFYPDISQVNMEFLAPQFLKWKDVIPIFFVCIHEYSKKVTQISCIQNTCSVTKIPLLDQSIDAGILKNFMMVNISLASSIPTKSDSSKLNRGLENEILRTAQLLLNFTAIPQYSKDGDIRASNSKDVLYEMVASRRADLDLTPTVQMSHMVNQFRYLVVGRIERLRAYYQPEPENSFSEMFTDQDAKVWFLLIAEIILITLSLKVILRFSGLNAVTAAIEVLTLQGITAKSYRLKWEWEVTVRMVCLVANISAFLLHAHISSNLVANLSVGGNMVKSLEGLVAKGYIFGLKNEDSYLRLSMLHGDIPKDSIIGRILGGPKFQSFKHTSESRDAVKRNKKLVLLTEKDLYTGSTKLDANFRDIVVQGEVLRMSGYVRRESALSDPFNFVLLRSWETGISFRYWKINTKARERFQPSRNHPSKRIKRSIGMNEIRYLFYFLLILTIISILIVLMEYWCNRRLVSRFRD